MRIVVTGAAGFVGFHVAGALLERGDAVLGIDNFSDYYPVSLKRDRVAALEEKRHPAWRLIELDLNETEKLSEHLDSFEPECVVHLAAQPGVRYSLEKPNVYVRNNVSATVSLLEAVRRLKTTPHLVLASSSSVYGNNKKVPFSPEDRTDEPVSLYAATKKSTELLAYSYHHLFDIPTTVLRFFTVYGPWGRPDMAPVIFGLKILGDESIPVYGDGSSKRDYTFAGDIAAGVLAAADSPDGFRVFNLGGDSPVTLSEFIGLLEKHLGKPAKRKHLPKQPGDVDGTWADISASRRELGYEPRVGIDEGLRRFCRWLEDYYRQPAETGGAG